MNDDITNVVTILINNSLLILFRSAKYQYQCRYWYLTERNLLKILKCSITRIVHLMVSEQKHYKPIYVDKQEIKIF